MKNQLANKRGFTLIELVLVLVIAGILSSIAISKINSNSLLTAARSLSQDIYILRHLALNYDVYDYTSDYDNSYWQIYFHCVANEKTSYNKYKCNHKELGYSIFSDKLGSNTSNPDMNELASDLLDNTKLIGTRFAGISIDDEKLSKRTNLTKSFGVQNIELFYQSKNKIRKANRLMMNELGEIFVSTYSSKTKSYNLIKSPNYVIRLSNGSENICIIINSAGFTNIPKIDKNNQIVWYSGIRKIPKYCRDLASK